MFAKLTALIITIGLIACVLLAVRQQRVQAAHDLAEVHQRVLQHDRTLWSLRAQVAARTLPSTLARAGERFGELAHNNPERFRDLVKRETEGVLAAASNR